MILISHRSNINGPDKDLENHPDQIKKVLNLGYHVEIDVWFVNNKFFLGHDNPKYEVNVEFILDKRFWHHAKNIEALHKLNNIKPNYLINCFYHQADDCVLTSGGWIWTYTNKLIPSSQGIAVLPETCPNWDISNAGGICSDYIKTYSKYVYTNIPM